MPSMQITAFSIELASGTNKRPVAGYVTFSDGREYRWSRQWDGTLALGGQRLRCGGYEDFRFDAPPKRAALIEARLNS